MQVIKNPETGIMKDDIISAPIHEPRRSAEYIIPQLFCESLSIYKELASWKWHPPRNPADITRSVK